MRGSSWILVVAVVISIFFGILTFVVDMSVPYGYGLPKFHESIIFRFMVIFNVALYIIATVVRYYETRPKEKQQAKRGIKDRTIVCIITGILSEILFFYLVKNLLLSEEFQDAMKLLPSHFQTEFQFIYAVSMLLFLFLGITMFYLAFSKEPS